MNILFIIGYEELISSFYSEHINALNVVFCQFVLIQTSGILEQINLGTLKISVLFFPLFLEHTQLFSNPLSPPPSGVSQAGQP